MRRTAALFSGAATVVAAVLLAGCAGADVTPTSSAPATTDATTSAPSPSPSPYPSPTPTATIPAADPDDPDTWLVSDAGIGPVVLGPDLATTAARMPAGSSVQEGCPWTATWVTRDPFAQLFAVRTASDVDAPVTEAYWGSTPDESSAWLGRGPRTADGIGLGTPWSTVIETYPTAPHTGLRNMGTGIQVGMVWITSVQEQVVDGIFVGPGEPPPEFCG